MKKTAQIILTLALIISSTKVALAQSALGLSAIPPRLEVTIKPGQHITKEIKIRNESDVDKIINTDVVDFIVRDDKGTPVRLEIAEKSNRWASSSWVQVGSQTKIKAGETKSLMVTIIAPENATAGGHYAMILHNPNNEAVLNQSGSNSSIETNVGTLVYITVPGDIKEDAKVDYFTAPKFQEYGPVDFKLSITNFSDIHIKPIGAIKVTNMLGGLTKSIKFNSPDTNEGFNIFPDTNRKFTETLNKKFLFGRYKAQLKATYGTAGGVLIGTVFFWVIPWRFLLLIVTAIIIIVLLVALFKKPGTKEQNDTIDELEKELEKLKKKYKNIK